MSRGLSDELRRIVGSEPLPAVVECSICTAPILSGTSVVTAVDRVVACPGCALEESAGLAVAGLSLYEQQADLATLRRAAEVLIICAAQFAASVAARKP